MGRFLLVLVAALCLGVVQVAHAQRAPDSPLSFAPFVEPGFPFITTTLDAGQSAGPFPARNLVARCLTLVLGNDTYACFDTDLLRVAAAWSDSFITLVSMPQVSYHKAGNKTNGIPRIMGEVFAATGLYPGWAGVEPTFFDPRPAGPNPLEIGRGPVDLADGRWEGVELADSEAILHYTVRGTPIREVMRAAESGRGLARTLELGARSEPLTLVLGEWVGADIVYAGDGALRIQHGDQITVARITEGPSRASLGQVDGRYVILTLPAGKVSVVVQVMIGDADATPPSSHFPESSSSRRWPETATTRGQRAPDDAAYVIDELTLPLPNPWQRNVRVSGLGFFEDGRAAVSTFEGDVWIVDGIDDSLKALRWSRFASGLCEPMSLSVVDGAIYVFGREGIVRLDDRDGNGEADFYANFSNLPVQSVESREFPLSMRERPGDGFLVAKGAALNAGPETSPAILPGFRAGGPHSGAVIAISADGRSMEVFAAGFREPYIGVHPETGVVTASDQQGNYVPSTPLYIVEPGAYYGVPATAHGVDMSVMAKPLIWIPHRIDRSGAEQVWVTGDRMGQALNGGLVHLSYGQPGIYRVFEGDRAGQGAIIPLPGVFEGPIMKGRIGPRDGQLYLAGFQVWDTSAGRTSTLYRYRYTGEPSGLPVGFEAGDEGIVLRFESPLEAADADGFSATRWNYRRTSDYGSGFFTLAGTPGQEPLAIPGVYLSADRQSVFVQVADMKPVMQFALGYRVTTPAGVTADTLYLTLNTLGPQDLTAFDAGAIAGARAAGPVYREAAAVEAPTAARGAVLYRQWGCVGCHSSDGTTEGRTGPTFKGLHGSRRIFTDGTTATADAAYLTRSMLKPDAQVVAGYQVGMQSYEGVLSEAEVASIVAFIEGLR